MYLNPKINVLPIAAYLFIIYHIWITQNLFQKYGMLGFKMYVFVVTVNQVLFFLSTFTNSLH